MMSESSLRVESPCVRICTLDDNDLCIGCFRTIEEIKCWHNADNIVRNKILAVAKKRSEKR